MLVSSFNLSQSFNCTPYLFYKKTVQNQRSILSVFGPRGGLRPQSTCNVPCGCVRHMLPSPPPSLFPRDRGVTAWKGGTGEEAPPEAEFMNVQFQ
jgi:hypothetical protein